jgi:hypothetical protein
VEDEAGRLIRGGNGKDRRPALPPDDENLAARE